MDAQEVGDALAHLPRPEAAIPFRSLLFLLFHDVDHGSDAGCLCLGYRAERDEWLW